MKIVFLLCCALFVPLIVDAEEFTLIRGEFRFHFEREMFGSYDVRRTFDGEIIRVGLEPKGPRPKPPAKLPEIEYPYLGMYDGEITVGAPPRIHKFEIKLGKGGGLHDKTNFYYGNITKDAADDLHVEMMFTEATRPIIDLKKAFTGKQSAKKITEYLGGEIIFKTDGSVFMANMSPLKQEPISLKKRIKPLDLPK